uniref:Uncharacterized protein n=1 Tax=Anguilla anguilla TaxID=7936 RepID=A0A0E9QTB4_ANGAN
MDTPTCAIKAAWGTIIPNGCSPPTPAFSPEILKIALGFSLVMNPSSCHTCPAEASGKEKYTAPPIPAGTARCRA